MASDYILTDEVWSRYCHLRDTGHLDYVRKAERCENFFAGMQWSAEDLALLKEYRRPALTINKIISTISNVLGEQIYNRTDVAFKPRNNGATTEVADVLTKVFSQVSDANQLPWVRSDVFADGIITSRGFFDQRLDFSGSLRGEAAITQLNPKNVLIDSDADEYDPDKWGDVIVSKWLSPDLIELMYSAAAARELEGSVEAYSPYGFDSMDIDRDRFGNPRAYPTGQSRDSQDVRMTRNIRVLDRQWRKLVRLEHFVNVDTGDVEPVPQEWDYNRISQYIQQNPRTATTKKMTQRVRWTVCAGPIVLHDDWSPYRHFTVVPYFPYFRRGSTIGLVENLLGPQELLNKVSSQELHVVNTSANSGWKVKTGALRNMSIGELENRGAMSGLVLELDNLDGAEKITPNATPTGLDRISYKAEEHIKSISSVSDYQTGNAREDVSAKSVIANKQAGSANFAKVMDNMVRTDHILARNILDCVQEFYTEERLLNITTDRLSNTTSPLTVNQVSPEGEVVNNLSLGEYDVVVTTQPERDTFEDTQFDQAVRLRTEVGIQVPDKYILMSSRLRDKAAIVKDAEDAAQAPEVQQRAQLEMRKLQADVMEQESSAQVKQVDARLKAAKARKELQEALNSAVEGAGAGDGQAAEMHKIEVEAQLEREKMDREFELKREQMEREFALKKQQMLMEMEIKEKMASQDALLKRAQAARAAPPKTGAKNNGPKTAAAA